jgi:AhpD family alkylhydroperoxidase
MAASPAVLEFYLAGSGALGKSALNAQEREVIQLAVGQSNDCDYCLAAHSAIGKGLGMSDAVIAGSRTGRISDSPKLAALATFAKLLNDKNGNITDADYNAFKAAGWTDAHAAEVVAGVSFAVFTNMFNHVNNTVLDFPAAPKL